LFEFFLLFPWFLLLADVGLILVLDWLLKKFKVGYHNPVLFVFLGSLLLITLFGSVVNMTSFHKNLMRMAEERHLPIPGVGGFYAQLRSTHRENGLFRGVVVALATSSFVIRGNDYDSDNSGILEIAIPEDIDINQILNIGDEVFIAVDVVNGQIRAYGIKKLTSEE
jgi:hypothetical protein